MSTRIGPHDHKKFRLTIKSKRAGSGRHPTVEGQSLAAQAPTDACFTAIGELPVGGYTEDADGDGWTRIQ